MAIYLVELKEKLAGKACDQSVVILGKVKKDDDDDVLKKKTKRTSNVKGDMNSNE